MVNVLQISDKLHRMRMVFPSNKYYPKYRTNETAPLNRNVVCSFVQMRHHTCILHAHTHLLLQTINYGLSVYLCI